MPDDNSSPAQCGDVSWKRNLAFIWISQFLSIMGFSFGIPFAPYFLQELGVPASELNMWVALFGAATPLTLAVFSPIWGAISDRYGRRPMLVRAYIGAGIVLALMGLSQGPLWLIVMRLAQGVLTGTVTASQTLVSAHTPKHRNGIALGSLNSAVLSGGLTGAFVGGFAADAFGYRFAFFLSGMMMFIAVGLVYFGVRESFRAPEREGEGYLKILSGLKPGKEEFKAAAPILVLMVAVMFVRQFDASFLPLLVQEIHGEIEGVSKMTGTLFAFSGVAGALSGFVLGWLADRMSPAKIGRYSAFCGGLLMVPQALATSFWLLVGSRFFMAFSAGGLDPVLQIWLSKRTPEKSRGLIFGWSASARAVGWFFAPLMGGAVATGFGLRYVFWIGAILYILLIPLMSLMIRRIGEESPPGAIEDAPILRREIISERPG